MAFLQHLMRWLRGTRQRSVVQVLDARQPDVLGSPVPFGIDQAGLRANAACFMALREIHTVEEISIVTNSTLLRPQTSEVTGRTSDGRYVTDVRRRTPVDRFGRQHGVGSAPCAVDGEYYASGSLVECQAHGHLVCREHMVMFEGVPMCLDGVRELQRQRLWDTLTFRMRRG